MREKQKFSLKTIPTQILVIFAAFLFMAPLYIVLNYSFKTRQELFTSNPLALPQSLSLENYLRAFERLNLTTTLFNTMFYTIAAVTILVIICGPAAWAIARNKGRFYKFIYIYFVIGIMIPAQALFLPMYIVGFNLGLVNNRMGVVFMFVATNLSFAIFLLTSFMSTVPIELEESARIDGCSIYMTYFLIVMPLLKPAIATLIIMQSFQIWNDYLMSSLFVSTQSLRPMTVALQALFSQHTSEYSTAFAAIVLTSLPMIVLFVSLQRYFIKGMTAGAVKG